MIPTSMRERAGNTLSVNTTSSINGINNNQGRMAADQGVTLNAGAGINNTLAQIESAAGAINLTAIGAITNTSGFVIANQNTTLNAASLNNANGQISGIDIVVTTTGALDNTGNASIVAVHDLTLNTGMLNNQSAIQ